MIFHIDMIFAIHVAVAWNHVHIVIAGIVWGVETVPILHGGPDFTKLGQVKILVRVRAMWIIMMVMVSGDDRTCTPTTTTTTTNITVFAYLSHCAILIR